MRVKRIPLDDVVTIARMVRLEPEEDEDEENPFGDDEGIKGGTYAMDGEGRVWRLEEVVTGLFQEFMDAGVNREKKKVRKDE